MNSTPKPALRRGRIKKSISGNVDAAIMKDGILWDALEHIRVLAMRDAGLAWERIASAYRLSDTRIAKVHETAWKQRKMCYDRGMPWTSLLLSMLAPDRVMPPVWRCYAHVPVGLMNKLNEARYRWTRPTLTKVTLYCDKHERPVEVLTSEDAVRRWLPVLCCLCKKLHHPVGVEGET